MDSFARKSFGDMSRSVDRVAELGRVEIVGNGFRNGPYRLDRKAGCEHETVSILDLSARGRHFKRALIAAFALLLEKRVARTLDPESAPGERHESHEQHEYDKLRAPHRKAHGEDRIRCEGDAFLLRGFFHRLTPRAGAEAGRGAGNGASPAFDVAGS